MKKRMSEYIVGKQASIFTCAISFLHIQRELGDYVLNDLTVNIGEAVVSTRVTVGQFLVIETHQVKNGCVQVVNMHPVFHCRATEFVG